MRWFLLALFVFMGLMTLDYVQSTDKMLEMDAQVNASVSQDHLGKEPHR